MTISLRWKIETAPDQRVMYRYAESAAEARNQTGCHEGYTVTTAGYYDSASNRIIDDPDDPTTWQEPATAFVRPYVVVAANHLLNGAVH